VGQRLFQAASAIVTLPPLIKVLGPAHFGVWGAAVSLVWLAGLVDLGVGGALVTLVAEAAALGRKDDARRHVTGALVVGSGLASLILMAAWVSVSMAVPQTRTGPYLIAVVGLAVNLPLSGANSVWLALQKGYVSNLWEFVQTLLTTAGLLGATLVSSDVRVYVAIVYGGLVLSNLGSLGHLMLRHPELRPGGLAGTLDAARSLAKKGMMYCAFGVVGSLSYLLDNVLALQLLGPEASARMTVALRVCVTGIGLLAVVSQPLWPAFAEAAARADLRWIRRGLVRGAAFLVGGAVAASAVLVAIGGPLLRWWLRADLGIGSAVLWAISAWTVAQALVRVPTLFLNAIWAIRFQVLVSAAATLTALGLKLLLAPRFGVAGILWSTAATVLAACPVLAWRIGRWAKKVRLHEQDAIGSAERI
jgi:O-antigen/teichoic acid export membrane protein